MKGLNQEAKRRDRDKWYYPEIRGPGGVSRTGRVRSPPEYPGGGIGSKEE